MHYNNRRRYVEESINQIKMCLLLDTIFQMHCIDIINIKRQNVIYCFYVLFDL